MFFISMGSGFMEGIFGSPLQNGNIFIGLDKTKYFSYICNYCLSYHF